MKADIEGLGQREYIEGVPFDSVAAGQDTVRCGLCGQIVDVGGELRGHVAEHREAEVERLFRE